MTNFQFSISNEFPMIQFSTKCIVFRLVIEILSHSMSAKGRTRLRREN